MNDYSILLHLLTRQRGENGEEIGSTTEEILKIFEPNDKNNIFRLNQILVQFSNYVRSLGLSVNFNPMNAHWYLVQDKDTVEFFKENQLFATPRLASTLLVILLLNILNKQTTITQVAKYRNVKNIKQDLKELKDMGYITYDENFIHITEKLVYNVNDQKLMERIEQEQRVQAYVERV